MSTHGGPIVVGVDGSVTADAAEEWAYGEARSRGLPLRLVAAYPAEVSWVDVAARNHVSASADPTIRREVEALMAARVERLRRRNPHFEVSFSTVAGDARTILLHEGATASVMVLGSRRRSALRSALLGSVGAALCSQAACPVVVIRQSAERLPDSAGVVVGVQPGVDCEEAIAFAFDHASRHGIPLAAVMCWVPDTMTVLHGDVTMAPGHVRAELSEALAGWREKYPDVETCEQIVLDNPADGLVFAWREQQLLVLGSRGRGAVSGLVLGSVSQAVLHHATSPVAVVGPVRCSDGPTVSRTWM